MNEPSTTKLTSSVAGETWSVVVLYEDKSTRDRAMTTCDRLVQHFWTEVEFDLRWWRTDFLVDPNMAQTAALDAREADILIFCSSDAVFSPTILQWFDRWVDARSGREGMLLDLTHASASPAAIATPKQNHLRHFAHRARLDYLKHLPPQIAGSLPDSWQSARARAGQLTAVLDDILKKLPPPSHYGLNE